MDHGPRVLELRVHDAELGVGNAFVDCPRERIRMPVIVCRACERCLRVCETEGGLSASVVCMVR
jgi:hypothetical protein